MVTILWCQFFGPPYKFQ